MWDIVCCLRKQLDGRNWTLNHQPSDLKSNALTTTPSRPHPQLQNLLINNMEMESLVDALLSSMQGEGSGDEFNDRGTTYNR